MQQVVRRHGRNRLGTAELLADLADIDRRRLYAPAGYPTLFAFCFRKLGMSEDEACRQMRAAKAARRFPVILGAIADGRLHVTGVSMLSKHLTEANADELLGEAMGKTKAQIELLIARRFPRPDMPTRLRPIPAPVAAIAQEVATVAAESPMLEPVAEPAESPALDPGEVTQLPALDPGGVTQSPVQIVAVPERRPRIVPLAPERFALQTTIDEETRDLLRQAQELLGCVDVTQVPDVLKAALRLYVRRLEKQKFAATDAPRPSQPRSSDSRHVPAEVRRAVWERDGGQCTFVSLHGHRCEERSGVEYDHAIPYARGGSATVSNIRLRCHAHNQLEAERRYGVPFMESKRAAGVG